MILSIVLLFCSLASGAAASTQLRQSKLQINADYWLKLANFNNVQYNAPLSIGGQTLPVIYDTGSFEVLVLSKLCADCEAMHAMYDQAQSSSFAGNNPAVASQHNFGSGSVISEKGFETIRIGDASSPIMVQRMPFWQVVKNKIDVWDENAHFSGIVGLAHPDVLPPGFRPANNAADSLLLKSMQVKSFGMCLQRDSKEAPGWIIFGPTVDNLPYGFRSMDVVGHKHWSVKMYDFHIPGIVQPDPCIPSCSAVIDSGTSLIAAPPSAMPAIRQLTAMIKKDCSNLHALPTLKFRIGDHDVELPPRAYVMKTYKKVVKVDVWAKLWDPQDKIQEQCISGFMKIDKSTAYGPVWILGMPFLRYYYTVFDRVNKKVHVTDASPTCQPQPASPAVAAATLFNSSHLATTGTRASMSSTLGDRFSQNDYEPNEVDIDAIRMPAWATDVDYGSFD